MCTSSSNFEAEPGWRTSRNTWPFSLGKDRSGDEVAAAMTEEVLVLIVASELDDERPASAEESSEYADKMLEMEATRDEEGSCSCSCSCSSSSREASWAAAGGDGARTVFVWDWVSEVELASVSAGADGSSGRSGNELRATGAAGSSLRLEKLLKLGRSGSWGSEDKEESTGATDGVGSCGGGDADGSTDRFESELATETELPTGLRRMARLGTAGAGA